jgi:3-oxosteroid 1-dehydrogenase
MGAIRAQEQGLKTLVVEKTELFGGTRPVGRRHLDSAQYDQKTAGIKDDLETAFGYMKRCVRGMATDDRVLAYVETASKMAEYLRQIGIPYRAMAKYADYYPHIEGSRPGGRTMDPVDFNAASWARGAGNHAPRPSRQSVVRPHEHQCLRGAFHALARAQVALHHPGHHAQVFSGLPWRNKTRRDRRMTGGQALVAGLLTAANKVGVEMWRTSAQGAGAGRIGPCDGCHR